MRRPTFARGAAVLLLANLFTRVLGFAYRALGVRLLGAEGMGLYEMVFPLYGLALVLTTAGLPLALAKITAEATARAEYQRARLAFAVCLLTLAGAGTVSALLFKQLIPTLAHRFLPDPRTEAVLTAVIPALAVVPVASAFRGWFQGLGLLARPAAAQALEQITRMLLGLYLAVRLLPRGLEAAASGLGLGMVAGEAAGLGYLVAACQLEGSWWRSGLGPRPGLIPTWVELWRLGWPVTLGRVVASATLALEAVLIPQRLQAAGYNLRQATELYGQFAGVAMTLLLLPTVLTLSLATAAVPAVAEAAAREHQGLLGRRIRDALRLSLVGGLPFAVTYLLFPQQLAGFLFGQARAGEPLRVLAGGAVFMYLQQTSTGILQGLGRPDLSTRHSLLGAGVLLAGVYWLTALPGAGLRGAAVAVVLSALTGCCLNLRSIARLTGSSLPARAALGAIAAGMAMGATALWVYRALDRSSSSLSPLLAALLLAAVVYLLAALATGALSCQDLARLLRQGE